MIHITETVCEINLQDLLDHTASRLLHYLQEVIEQLSDTEAENLELICKWGRDGYHQMQYKQKFENIADSDAHIFQSSMVPLQLLCKVNQKVIWQNRTPSSPRFCRPIRILFAKETAELTKQKINHIKDKISKLNSLKITEPKTISVKYKMAFTMIDAKVCNAATDTKSTLRCYICKATSKDCNKLMRTHI